MVIIVKIISLNDFIYFLISIKIIAAPKMKDEKTIINFKFEEISEIIIENNAIKIIIPKKTKFIY